MKRNSYCLSDENAEASPPRGDQWSWPQSPTNPAWTGCFPRKCTRPDSDLRGGCVWCVHTRVCWSTWTQAQARAWETWCPRRRLEDRGVLFLDETPADSAGRGERPAGRQGRKRSWATKWQNKTLHGPSSTLCPNWISHAVINEALFYVVMCVKANTTSDYSDEYSDYWKRTPGHIGFHFREQRTWPYLAFMLPVNHFTGGEESGRPGF